MQYAIQKDPEALRVTMEGPFTFQDSLAFQTMLRSIQSAIYAAEIRLNMKRLESIDAMALNMLLIAYDAMKKSRRPLVFEQPQGQVQEALNQAAQHNALTISN
ncbi:MAG: STAS domain-containing protein [Alphaproteobacteria bacterium]|nr:STAS domain-containing protein [Alphaproteobacteria bacterium]